MGFFDLNIPYTESNKQNSTTAKSSRLKLVVKAMEFGYSGVAYNRTITGVMSELDRCSISLFPLSSLLKVSPSLSSSVNLHRRLLDVPTSTPFRQYTRLTVVVDTPAQGSSLNSGNPVLKTYDIVAVRPLKQESFDQACKNYQVDIIAIDFSENRFRLKQPLIKAAIERGVYFEITYSGLIMDAQLRRQMISNAKLLVDWTRGKNLILSSAAPSVTELRGPHDVANLASLLGFSVERAKASVSKTCRSLLINALRKKKFFKEAIKVERMTPAEQCDIEGAGFDDWLKWDPISSGEGDLQLDDMAKSFASYVNKSETVKAIDFVSSIDGSPLNGTKEISRPHDSGINLSAITKTDKSIPVNELHVDSELDDPHEKDQTSVMETLEKGDILNYDNCNFSSITETVEALATVEGGESCAVIIEEQVKIVNDPKVCFSHPEAKLEPEVPKAISEENVTNDENETAHTLAKDAGITYACSALPTAGISISFEDHPSIQSEVAKDISFSAPIRPPIVALNEVYVESDAQSKGALSLYEKLLGEHMKVIEDVGVSPASSAFPSSSVSVHAVIPEGEHMTENGGDVSIAPADSLASLRSHGELQTCATSVIHEPLEDVLMEDRMEFKEHTGTNRLSEHESSSERLERKRRSSRSISFPFKRFLKPSHFKKKTRKLKTRRKIL